MVIDELIKAKNGDHLAAENIINHYSYFIYYLMNEYGISNKTDCYDLSVERILKCIYKFII